MTTTIQLSPDLEQRLAELARQTNCSTEFHLREIIEHGLSEVEGYYRAVATLDRIRKGEERTYTLEEVREQLGLDD